MIKYFLLLLIFACDTVRVIDIPGERVIGLNIPKTIGRVTLVDVIRNDTLATISVINKTPLWVVIPEYLTKVRVYHEETVSPYSKCNYSIFHIEDSTIYNIN